MGVNPLLGNGYITPDGVFSQDQLLVAQVIHDYDETLSLVRIEDPKPGQKNCAVICTPHIGQPYAVFYVDLKDVGPEVIRRVFQADMIRHGKNGLAAEMEAREAAQRILNQLKAEEIQAEAMEFAVTVLKSPLHTYKHKGKVYR